MADKSMVDLSPLWQISGGHWASPRGPQNEMNLPIPTQEPRTTPLSMRRQGAEDDLILPQFTYSVILLQERSRGRAEKARSFRRWALSPWMEAPVRGEAPFPSFVSFAGSVVIAKKLIYFQ